MTCKRIAAVTTNSSGATPIMKSFSHIVHRYINRHKSNSSRVHIIKSPTIQVMLHDLIVPALMHCDIRAVNPEFSVFITAGRDSNALLDSYPFQHHFQRAAEHGKQELLPSSLNSHSFRPTGD